MAKVVEGFEVVLTWCNTRNFHSIWFRRVTQPNLDHNVHGPGLRAR